MPRHRPHKIVDRTHPEIWRGLMLSDLVGKDVALFTELSTRRGPLESYELLNHGASLHLHLAWMAERPRKNGEWSIIPPEPIVVLPHYGRWYWKEGGVMWNYDYRTVAFFPDWNELRHPEKFYRTHSSSGRARISRLIENR